MKTFTYKRWGETPPLQGNPFTLHATQETLLFPGLNRVPTGIELDKNFLHKYEVHVVEHLDERIVPVNIHQDEVGLCVMCHVFNQLKLDAGTPICRVVLREYGTVQCRFVEPKIRIGDGKKTTEE